MLDFTITFTGGGAIFAIGCIVYFIAGMLVEIGKWVEKKRKNKEEKTMNQFNVLNWDINRNELESYDVLPYFRKCYEECKKDKPVTIDEWKEFIRQEGMYMFWSRCEYEVIISPWPPQKKDVSVKIDVWQQIKNNLDLIVKLLMEEYDTKN